MRPSARSYRRLCWWSRSIAPAIAAQPEPSLFFVASHFDGRDRHRTRRRFLQSKGSKLPLPATRATSLLPRRAEELLTPLRNSRLGHSLHRLQAKSALRSPSDESDWRPVGFAFHSQLS